MRYLQKQSFSFLSILLLSIGIIQAQPTLPAISANYFRNPLDIPMYLAGNFGEIRSNHFHSGLDIKTNQREGYPVFAVADGYVSRLRVQVGGFGNAMYIIHPNGITSVYAHLQKYTPMIAARVKGRQYQEQSFAQDFVLTPIEIRVKKGDLIAWSGNSGSSGGPHLHFEFRNTQTEETINPLTLGLKIKDTIKPQISALYVFKTNKFAFSESTPKQYFGVSGSNGVYSLGSAGTISVNGEFGLGISALDQQDGSPNHNGLFSTTIKLDGKIIFETVMDKFAFENSRAINAFIDYPSKLTSGRVIQKGFIADNPKLKLFKSSENKGLIELQDDLTHQIEYILKDISGNQSVLRFNVKKNIGLPLYQASLTGEKMAYGAANAYANTDIKMALPIGVLYNDIYFDYAEKPQPKNGESKIYQLHNKLTPLHTNYDLSIKVDSTALANVDKLIIYQIETGSQGGIFKDGYIHAKPRTFGNFYLRIDSVAPSVWPINIKDGGDASKQSRVIFKISDNLSGLKSFNGYIDDQWVLMEYDLRNGHLWHTFDENFQKGKHNLKIVVSDNKDNIKTYQLTFYR